MVPNGGSVNSDTARSSMPHSGIDLPDIAFGAQTTLAYARERAGNGGTLTVRTAATPRRSRFSATTWPEALSPSPTAMAAR